MELGDLFDVVDEWNEFGFLLIDEPDSTGIAALALTPASACDQKQNPLANSESSSRSNEHKTRNRIRNPAADARRRLNSKDEKARLRQQVQELQAQLARLQHEHRTNAPSLRLRIVGSLDTSSCALSG